MSTQIIRTIILLAALPALVACPPGEPGDACGGGGSPSGEIAPCATDADCPPTTDECTIMKCGTRAPTLGCYTAPLPEGTPCTHSFNESGTCSTWTADAGVACVPINDVVN